MVVATDVAAVARSASADALEPATLCQDFEDREKFKAGHARRASRAGFAKS